MTRLRRAARLYWVVSTAFVLAVTLILATSVSSFASPHTVSGMWRYIGVSSALFGLALIVNGYLNYRLLVRSLDSVAQASSTRQGRSRDTRRRRA